MEPVPQLQLTQCAARTALHAPYLPPANSFPSRQLAGRNRGPPPESVMKHVFSNVRNSALIFLSDHQTISQWLRMYSQDLHHVFTVNNSYTVHKIQEDIYYQTHIVLSSPTVVSKSVNF
jgi:hypothetical protein